MTVKARKRSAIREGTVNILAGNEPMSLQSLTARLKETVKPDRGVYKITDQIVAQALRGQTRIHKFTRNGISMYYAD